MDRRRVRGTHSLSRSPSLRSVLQRSDKSATSESASRTFIFQEIVLFVAYSLSMIKILFIILTFSFWASPVYAMPSSETMECLVDKVIEDCRGYKIYGDCARENGELSCGMNFDNDDRTGIKSYLNTWVADWEEEAQLVHSSPSPFGCVNTSGESHAFRLDSSYNPQWDGKAISCPSEVTKITNWTVFGFQIYSLGGITIISFSIFGFAILGSLFTFVYLVKKRKISIFRYTIMTKKDDQTN